MEWTFHLRQDATWVSWQGDYRADVVSEDFVYGLEWVLNSWKNDSYNTTSPTSLIEGAEDYYLYTRDLSEDEAWDLDIEVFLDMVGIETPDDYTVIYRCNKPCPYFETMITSSFAFPISKGQLDQNGPKAFKGTSPWDLWYCGPYVVTDYVDGNTMTFSPNPAYWNRDNVTLFDSYTVLKTESNDTAWELFELGTTNNIGALSTAQTNILSTDSTNPWHDYLVAMPPSGTQWGLYFNWGKKKIDDDSMDIDWNRAAANENFRQCFYYGLDLYNYYSTIDGVDPASVADCCMTAYGISTLSDGSDYTDLVKEQIGLAGADSYSHQDTGRLASYKEAAMAELAEEGVTFPIHMDIWAGSSQDSGNTYTILKETIEDALGSDFVEVDIHTYITQQTSEVYTPSSMSVEVQGRGAEYCDPTAYLNELCNDQSGNASYADTYGHIAECENQSIIDQIAEFTDMVRTADAMTGDHDARLRALAEAEAYAINHALVLPTNVKNKRAVTCLNHYSRPCAINDTQSKRYVNVESKADFYTIEDYDAIKAAYMAGN